MAPWHLPPELALWVAQLSWPLHGRLAGHLLPLLTGLLFAKGRRTVASWLRGGGLGDDYRTYYAIFAGTPVRNAAFTPRGAVGLVVYNARAAYRNVKLTPLP
jgi:hypothetical protein